MTPRQVITALQQLPDLDSFDVSVKIGDEYSPLRALQIIENDDEDADGVLDVGSPVLICTESKHVMNEYPDAECPDCGLPIPAVAANGSECSQCDHVFWYSRKADDE